MGNADRLIRIIVAIVISVLYFTGKISGTAGVILLLLGGIFVLTSLLGTCPLYIPFGISTCREKK